MKRATKKKNRPAPPEELDGEALLEWHRVCDELEKCGRLKATDRAILHVYVGVWALHRAAEREVTAKGFTSTFNKGDIVALSPAFHAMKDSARQLRTLLNDLGLTPAKRGVEDADPETVNEPLDF